MRLRTSRCMALVPCGGGWRSYHPQCINAASKMKKEIAQKSKKRKSFLDCGGSTPLSFFRVPVCVKERKRCRATAVQSHCKPLATAEIRKPKAETNSKFERKNEEPGPAWVLTVSSFGFRICFG